MTINLHIIIIHFPIALFTIYSILELLKSKLNGKEWDKLKSFLLYIGIITAIISIMTGSIIEDDFESKFKNLFEMHELFATLSFWLFAIITSGYFLKDIKSKIIKIESIKKYENLYNKYINLICNSYLTYILVVIAMLSLVITGALGGAMVSGPDAEPLTRLIYNLLIK